MSHVVTNCINLFTSLCKVRITVETNFRFLGEKMHVITAHMLGP